MSKQIWVVRAARQEQGKKGENSGNKVTIAAPSPFLPTSLAPAVALIFQWVKEKENRRVTWTRDPKPEHVVGE